MSGTVKISYNVNNIKSNITWDVKNIIFKWQGIIFGGFVRDSIIAEHYGQLFWEKHNYNKHYWNEQFDPSTAARTLIPNDVDICLNNEQNVNKMMEDITALFIREFGNANVKFTKRLLSRNSLDFKSYIDNPIGNLYTYTYTIVVGEIPYVSLGTPFNYSFDIITTPKKHLKPPFNRLDFLCNCFIMTNHGEIMMSNCTGTEIDKLKLVDKKEIESKILKDMINFKTDYCMKFMKITNNNSYASVKSNSLACNRIEKMCNKKYPWTIQNMPIIIEQPKKHVSMCRNCCICQDTIKNKQRYIAMPALDSNNKEIQGPPMHTDCFFKYMNSQIQDKKRDCENISYNIGSADYEDNCKIFLRCPMRNEIDFDIQNITNIIERYLKS